MKTVYIITMECENSVDCCVYGVWKKYENAVEKLKKLVSENANFNEESFIDYEEGIAQSDPEYCEDEYTDYKICAMPVMDLMED